MSDRGAVIQDDPNALVATAAFSALHETMCCLLQRKGKKKQTKIHSLRHHKEGSEIFS